MAKLGSDKRPLILRVQTQARAQEVLAVCEDHGWKAIVGIEPDNSETFLIWSGCSIRCRRRGRKRKSEIMIPAPAAPGKNISDVA